MPAVTAMPTKISTGENVTDFVDSVGMTSTTYTFPLTQEKLKVSNESNGSIQVTVNATTVTLLPTDSREFFGTIDSFSIVSTAGVQSFRTVATNYKDEQLQLTGSLGKALIYIQRTQSALAAGSITDEMLTNKVPTVIDRIEWATDGPGTDIKVELWDGTAYQAFAMPLPTIISGIQSDKLADYGDGHWDILVYDTTNNIYKYSLKKTIHAPLGIRITRRNLDVVAHPVTVNIFGRTFA